MEGMISIQNQMARVNLTRMMIVGINLKELKEQVICVSERTLQVEGAISKNSYSESISGVNIKEATKTGVEAGGGWRVREY